MKKKSSARELLQKLGTLMALAILVIIFCVIMPDKFPKIANIMNILKQASINCLIASGMLCALITAGIDLSVGSNCVLCTCTIGVLVERFGIHQRLPAGHRRPGGEHLRRLHQRHPADPSGPAPSLRVHHGHEERAVGPRPGHHGVQVHRLHRQGRGRPDVGRGGSLFTTRNADGTVAFPGIPFSFILVLIVFCIFHVFLTRSALGRQIYCVGGNPEAARLSGIPSKNVLTFVYTLSGFMAGMAGVISVGRLASANGNAGQTYDNDAIAACIVGGASFTGGKGTIWGTLIGALLMAVIRNGLNLMGASNDIQYIVIGAVIILAVTIDVFRNKAEAKARKMAAQ